MFWRSDTQQPKANVARIRVVQMGADLNGFESLWEVELATTGFRTRRTSPVVLRSSQRCLVRPDIPDGLQGGADIQSTSRKRCCGPAADV